MNFSAKIVLASLGLLPLCVAPARADGVIGPGTLYIGNVSTSGIEKVDSSGHTTFFGSTGGDVPLALALDGTGTLFAATEFGAIYKYSSSGQNFLFAGVGLNNVTALASDGHGNLYAANLGGGAGQGYIEKYDSQGHASLFANTGAIQPSGGLVFDSSGNLYVALDGNQTIEKYDTQGGVSFFASVPSPYAMTMHNDTLYVATGNDEIYKVDSQGNASLFANSGLSGTFGLAFGGDGNLYAVNGNSETVTKFDSAGNPTLFAAENFNMRGLVIQPVPEPAAWLVLLAGMSALILQRRFQREKTS